MLFKKLAVSVAVLSLSTFTLAEAPNVVTDIAPIHSVVTQVMKGVAKPTLLVKPEYSPHEYTLRPSEARALSKADVVFWIGEDYTPWLEKSLDNVAGSAHQIALMEIAGTTLLDFREDATFEAHAHDDHDDHDDHEEHEEHDHTHESHDPHVWLDPVNAQVWVQEIANTLAEKDPENAATYQANAINTVARLEDLISNNQAKANELGAVKFIVFHDAYQYFEVRFGVLATGAISVSDASDPSPARVAEIRETVANLGVSCVYTEPQYNTNMVKSVFKGTDVLTTGVLDPIGADIKPGENQYFELINNLMDSVSECKS